MESKRSNATFHGVTFDVPALHGVYILRNFFSHDECDKLILESEQWGTNPAEVYHTPGQFKDAMVDHKTRKGHVRHWDLNSNGPSWFHSILKTAANRYADLFPHHPSFDRKNPKLSVEVACYTEPGDHFTAHQDVYIRSEHCVDPVRATQTRKLSMSCILSDEHSGCMLEMINGRDKHPIPTFKGDIVLFPSYAVHRVTPLEDGKRYALICWVLGDFWR